jgi:hypothetical protein
MWQIDQQPHKPSSHPGTDWHAWLACTTPQGTRHVKVQIAAAGLSESDARRMCDAMVKGLNDAGIKG